MTLTPRSHRQLYRRFLRSDRRLDGRVWVAVRTTGIYCLPSCTARKPRLENVRFFSSRGDAEQGGFRPCRRCRPDVHGGRLAMERAALKGWLETLAGEERNITAVAEAQGVSPSRLYRLFRRHLGHGPRQARARARLHHACEELRSREKSVTEVAYEAGFGSLAAFYRWFRRTVGQTPTAYRQSTQREGVR